MKSDNPANTENPAKTDSDVSGSIEVRNVSHTFVSNGEQTHALDDISFEVPTGQFVSIVGPSGCGKSSLLMMLAGLRAPDEGSIVCGGRPIKQPDPERIGVIFQEASLFPWLTAQKNVEFPLSLRGVKPEVRRKTAREALALVGLEGFDSRYPHELSGGMKQRVSLARGLVQDPPILMMDEPFAALDEQTRIVMGDELLRIWEQTRKTILFVTHSLGEAIYLADQVLVMSPRPGRIVDRIDVDLPRPRKFEMMSTQPFMDMRERIWRQIRT